MCGLSQGDLRASCKLWSSAGGGVEAGRGQEQAEPAAAGGSRDEPHQLVITHASVSVMSAGADCQQQCTLPRSGSIIGRMSYSTLYCCSMEVLLERVL